MTRHVRFRLPAMALGVLLAAAPLAAQVATISIVDSAGNVGRGSDVAYGPDGLALISYLDVTNGALKVAHCNDVACTSAATHTLDGSAATGGKTSIAFGPDGRGLISYQSGLAVKIAHCADAACTSATLATVDPAAGALDTALAIGTDGLGVVVYRGATGDALNIAHCLDANCSSATITGYPGLGGYNPTVTIGGDGLPLVLCDGVHAYELQRLHCANPSCTAATFSAAIVLSVRPTHPSLTTRSDGLAELAYAAYWCSPALGCSFTTWVVSCTDAVCTFFHGEPGSTQLEFFDDYPDLSLALLPGDRALVAKHAGNRLLVTRCLDATCPSSQQDLHVDFVGTDASPAVAVNPAGIGLVSYYDSGNGDLKAAYLNLGLEPALYVADVAVTEGNAGSTAAVFQVTKQASVTSASVDFATGGGTATPGVDYVASSGTLVFPPGSTSQTITVQVNGDVTPEPDETFFVTLSNPQGAGIGDGVGQGTILSDDISEISIGDVIVVEGNVGTTPAYFPLNRIGAASASVDFETHGATADVGIDFVYASGTVVFPPGNSTQTITVEVIGDLAVEPIETFRVMLSNPQGGTITDDTGEGKILDNDVAALPVRSELTHGSRIAGDLGAAPGPVADVDYYRFGVGAYGSYEVVADALSGDVQPFELTRTLFDGATVLQTAAPSGVGSSVALRWQTQSYPVYNQFIRARSGGCGTDCGPDDVYHLRAYETTLTGARFNNSGSQVTVLLLQNPTAAFVWTWTYFWAADGSLLATRFTSLPPHGLSTLNTAQISGLSGIGGAVTVTHTAPYGALSGKTVALEPSTGFSFDTPLLPKSR